MNLGWCDFCLRVGEVRVSRKFYERLGFHRVEGDDAEGWAVVVNDSVRIGLFEPKHLPNHNFTLNFRGANIRRLVAELKEIGFEFVADPTMNADGSGSAKLLDPDGNLIFFDSAPGETKLN